MIWTTLSELGPPLPEDDGPTVPLRSLYLGCSPDTAIAALGTVRLVPFTADGPADTGVSESTDTLFAVSSAQDRLLIGVQAISNTRTACTGDLRVAGILRGRGQISFPRLGAAIASCHRASPSDGSRRRCRGGV